MNLLDSETDWPGHGTTCKAAGAKLSPTDRMIRSTDLALRALGASGFETQMLVYLSTRLDTARLRKAALRFGRNNPIVLARLIETGGRPHWRFRPGSECVVNEMNLPSANPDEVLNYAADLLATPNDPTECNPIRFHLLHRPEAGDVFLAQYNHTLMDNNAAIRLLRELDRFDDGGRNGEIAPPPAEKDLVWSYLRRFPRQRRRIATAAALKAWSATTRGGVKKLGQKRAGGPAAKRPRISARCLNVSITQALRERVTKVCGYPNYSMALLASAFRAVERLSPQSRGSTANFVAAIGLDLGLRGKTDTVFHNLVSAVPIRVRLEDLPDRDELLRILSRQLREKLAGDLDLGALHLTAQIGRYPRQTQLALEMFMQFGLSLWFGYFGSLDAAGSHFFGAEIENVLYVGPSWSPVGLTLIANQFRGRLLLQASYVPESVPESLANAFLDELIRDVST
jgi:hypothetical protein